MSSGLIRVPCGSRQKCRFAFLARQLTDQELTAFEAGGILPDGVGLDPPKVLFEFQRPRNDKTEVLEGGAVTREAKGEYHVELAVTMAQDGTWQWRARGEEEDGTPVACTPPQSFDAYRAF